MKRAFAAGVVIVLAVVLAASAGHGQIFFNSQGSVTSEGGNFFLTLPEIRVVAGADSAEGWVKWRLNQNNYSWEIFEAGFTSDIPKLGPRTASGRYLYNAQKGLLVVDIESSNFLGCGIDTGIQILGVSGITATESTLTVVDVVGSGGLPPLPCTRAAGTAGDIVGVWSCVLGPLGTLTIDARADGTLSMTGVMQMCLVD